jgi:16S rRNA (cytosine967-C5)-methyltransferase
VLESRRIAHTVLVRVEQGGAFANRALDAALSEAGVLDPRDVSLATELAYGTLRRQIGIDHALRHFSKRPLEELEPDTRALLRLGAHQILNLRIPDRASVHATVELAKEVRHGRPVPFVNAVLRSLARERANVLVPPAAIDPAGHLEVTESFPRWFVESLLAERPFDEVKALLASLNQPAPLNLRVNLRRGTRAEAQRLLSGTYGLDSLPTLHSPAGLVLDALAPALLLRPEEGRWQAQDEAAQLVGFFAAPEPGMTVLDACAAPGGKTCHLAELMDDRGRVDAIDVHPNKVREVNEGARRLGLTIVRAEAGDATAPVPGAPVGGYDLVMADTPCSGWGTVRRHPELKTRRTAADTTRLAQMQSGILDNLAGVVKPGGVLVYALCTFTQEEGPRQVERFLARHPEFVRDAPPSGPVDFGPLTSAAGDLTLDPHRHGTDAFFAARLRRRA